MKLSARELKEQLEFMPDDTEIYLAVYQHYTPPEDRVTNFAVYEPENGPMRLYLEGKQTGNYVPGEVRDELGWY